nr:hypothetical protein [Paraburkholderia lycopersici]
MDLLLAERCRVALRLSLVIVNPGLLRTRYIEIGLQPANARVEQCNHVFDERFLRLKPRASYFGMGELPVLPHEVGANRLGTCLVLRPETARRNTSSLRVEERARAVTRVIGHTQFDEQRVVNQLHQHGNVALSSTAAGLLPGFAHGRQRTGRLRRRAAGRRLTASGARTPAAPDMAAVLAASAGTSAHAIAPCGNGMKASAQSSRRHNAIACFIAARSMRDSR